jgi:hypothetical protein
MPSLSLKLIPEPELSFRACKIGHFGKNDRFGKIFTQEAFIVI